MGCSSLLNDLVMINTGRVDYYIVAVGQMTVLLVAVSICYLFTM
jgi:hypothetical protein